uniref:Concanavalin A-like lectin/glucanase superfamily protein n=1 Tax=Salinispora arenicola (strain CNS-205) TaxID=391037 RepID=A8LZY5_SALAI
MSAPARFEFRVEIHLGALGWVDITADVRGSVKITRGRTAEGRRVDRGTASMRLDNSSGSYSPRRPTGAYYGVIGRNTPLRVSAGLAGGTLHDRFYGEVSSWPPQWSVTGVDRYVDITASGVLRRLGQGASPLRSPLHRAITGTGPVSYWPVEDGSGSTQAASGLPGGTPLTATGEIAWASVTSPGSSPLPDWSRDAGGLTGPVTGVTDGDDWAIRVLVQFGTGATWDVLVAAVTGDSIYDELRIELSASSVLVAAVAYGPDSSSLTYILTDFTDYSDELPHWLEVGAADAGGGTVTYTLRIDGALRSSTTTAGSPGVPHRLHIGPRTDGTAALGHIGVWRAPSTDTWTTVAPAVTGHAGETAGRRIERLCHEEGTTCHIVGDPDDTVTMGAQPTGTLLELIRQCEDVDQGILYEPREVLGLAYRTVRSRYNQPVTLALTFGADGEVAPPLEPVDDDRHVRNDVTASRSGGSSYRAEVTSGPLSTAAPPDGVGRYDHRVTVNVPSDSHLADQASWRTHLGTWDEARYPTIRVDLAALSHAGKPTLITAAAAVDVGDRLTIGSPPVWLPPDAIDQHSEGYTETIDQYTWDLRLVCVPAGPYAVAVVDGPQRVAADGSTIAAVDAATLTLTMTSTTENGAWTTGAADFPLDLLIGGGERVTATGITGTGLTQTVTLSGRAVNGVGRAWPDGTSVQVWAPAIAAL